MERLRRFIEYRLLKAAICLVSLSFWTASGHAQIGTPPVIAVQPLGLAVQNGGTAVITATAVSLTKMNFYWYFNNHPVPTTNTTVVTLLGVSTLTVKNVSPANEGVYSLRITNAVGGVVSSNAALIVLTSVVSNVVNILSAGTGMTADGFQIHLSGPAGSNCVIQASTDLKNWVSISTNAAPDGNVSYTDTAAKNLPFRYYRAKTQ